MLLVDQWKSRAKECVAKTGTFHRFSVLLNFWVWPGNKIVSTLRERVPTMSKMAKFGSRLLQKSEYMVLYRLWGGEDGGHKLANSVRTSVKFLNLTFWRNTTPTLDYVVHFKVLLPAVSIVCVWWSVSKIWKTVEGSIVCLTLQLN